MIPLAGFVKTIIGGDMYLRFPLSVPVCLRRVTLDIVLPDCRAMDCVENEKKLPPGACQRRAARLAVP
ncbi:MULTISPECIES: hypothetical protein [unclassified Cupriavidus]|uniref:hypothetical protein n=1 Tax=unclassified Cupriavidus TaxID=2640874 RepID=UPI00295E6B62|nr:hypothetical protein [Cupriavidus sp. TA19]